MLQTLGSLQKALRHTEGSHEDQRQEADSLWRENRELRGEMTLLQKENADLRNQVGQFQRELEAERLRSQQHLLQLQQLQQMQKMAASQAQPEDDWAAPPHRLRQLATRLASPHGACETADREREWEREGVSSRGTSRAGSPSTGFRLAVSPPTASAKAQTPAVGAHVSGQATPDALVDMSTRHAGEIAEIHMTYARRIECMQEEVELSKSCVRTADVRVGCLQQRNERVAKTVRGLLEVAGTHAVLCATIGAWRREVAEHIEARRVQGVNRVHQRADAHLAASHSRLDAVTRIIHSERTAFMKAFCMSIWAGLRRARSHERDLSGKEAELNQGRSDRQAQISWLYAAQASKDMFNLVRAIVVGWRSCSSTCIAEAATIALKTSSARHVVHFGLLEKMAFERCRGNLLRYVLAEWAHARRGLAAARDRRASLEATAARTMRSEKCIAMLRASIGVSQDDALKRQVWVAFRLMLRESWRDAEVRRSKAEQARAHLAHMDKCVQHVFGSGLAAQDHVYVHRVWMIWYTVAARGGLARSVEGLESRLAATRSGRRWICFRAVGWGVHKADLYRAFCAWLRRLRGRAATERQLYAERAQFVARRSTLLKSIGEHLVCLHDRTHLSNVWQSWRHSYAELLRSNVACTMCVRDAQRRQRLDDALTFSVNNIFRAQASFVIRTCFTVWRRLRPMEQLLSGGEELVRLRGSYARLSYANGLQTRVLGDHLVSLRAAAIAYIGWSAWRRRRHESTLCRDLEALQTLLESYRINDQKQKSYEAMDRLLGQTQVVERLTACTPPGGSSPVRCASSPVHCSSQAHSFSVAPPTEFLAAGLPPPSPAWPAVELMPALCEERPPAPGSASINRPAAELLAAQYEERLPVTRHEERPPAPRSASIGRPAAELMSAQYEERPSVPRHEERLSAPRSASIGRLPQRAPLATAVDAPAFGEAFGEPFGEVFSEAPVPAQDLPAWTTPWPPTPTPPWPSSPWSADHPWPSVSGPCDGLGPPPPPRRPTSVPAPRIPDGARDLHGQRRDLAWQAELANRHSNAMGTRQSWPGDVLGSASRSYLSNSPPTPGAQAVFAAHSARAAQATQAAQAAQTPRSELLLRHSWLQGFDGQTT